MSPSLIADVLERVADQYDPQPKELAYDPVKWVHDRGDFLWSKQREIMESVRDNRFTAVPSCHGTGKSFIGSEVVAWWLDTHPDAFVVTSAPSSHQVKAILWREIRRRKAKGGLPGIISDAEVPTWKINGELVAFGRKPADYVDEDKAATVFQGIHALHVLVVLDEAAGIPGWLWTAAETLVTNERSRILAIGNPTDPSSEFEKVCRPGSGWNVIQIGYADTPAFTGEFVPAYLLDLLISKLWVRERRRRWGRGSPLFIARVLGKFPDVTEDTMFSPALIRQCQEVELPGDERGRYGADIADMGSDLTTVYANRGGRIRRVKHWGKKDPMQTAGRIARILDAGPRGMPVVVDSIGVGSGVVARLKERNYPVIPFGAGEAPRDKKKFKNKRSEQWWMMRELAEDMALDLPPDGEDDDLIAQIGAIKFDFDSAGRVVLEPKAKTAKRVGASPDFGDAAMMSTYAGAGLADWLEEMDDDEIGVTKDLTAGLLEERL